jgi:DNA polymerase-1
VASRFIILDGNAIVHRAYHALPPLTNPKGESVQAVYGFANLLLKVLKDLKPAYAAVAFDLPGPTFRHKVYAEYKATRVKAPQDLYDQIPLAKELVSKFGIPVLEKEGYEADDVIGSLVATEGDVEKVIVTGDNDTLQLVGPATKVFTLRKGMSDTVLYDERAVREKYGFPVKYLVDFKALRGDPSDNIPGVKGIGEKTATGLIQTFGPVENLYAALSKNTPKAMALPERVRVLLTERKQEALLSKKLATIVTTVPVPKKLAHYALTQYDKDTVLEFLRRQGFRSLFNRIPEPPGTKHVTDAKGRSVKSQQGALLFGAVVRKQRKGKGEQYALVEDDDAFGNLLKKLKAQRRFAVDTETTELNPRHAELLGISFAWEPRVGWFVSTRDAAKRKAWLRELAPVLENPAVEKIGHNLKFDLEVLAENGVDMEGVVFDTMIASYLLNPGTRAHSLETLALAELNYAMQPLTELIGPRGKGQLPMAAVPVADLSWYSAEDADITWRLAEKLAPKLERADVQGLFGKIEMPVVAVLARMESVGVKIDGAALSEMAQEYGGRLKKLERKAVQLAGREFNVASPLQLKEVLFETLRLSAKGLGRTKTGISTAAEELEKLKDAHPLIPVILEYRELQKLKSTYLDALPELVDPKTGRVHTSFNQAVAATGRLSSSDPNLQNIPIRGPEAARIRRAFTADRGFRIVSADYSQIELRIAASLANDPKMIAAFHARADIHTATAAVVFDVPPANVTPEQRRNAKVVNFGILYGLGSAGLAAGTGMTRDEARAFIDKYFTTYTGVARYVEETKKLARRTGYVETLFGRRRYLPEINSKNGGLASAAERMAVNAPIQGTAADLMKMAMIAVDREVRRRDDVRMVLQVHDELVFEVKESSVPSVSKLVKTRMEGVAELRVPIEVEVHSGRSWGEAKEG